MLHFLNLKRISNAGLNYRTYKMVFTAMYAVIAYGTNQAKARAGCGMTTTV